MASPVAEEAEVAAVAGKCNKLKTCIPISGMQVFICVIELLLCNKLLSILDVNLSCLCRCHFLTVKAVDGLCLVRRRCDRGDACGDCLIKRIIVICATYFLAICILKHLIVLSDTSKFHLCFSPIFLVEIPKCENVR